MKGGRRQFEFKLRLERFLRGDVDPTLPKQSMLFYGTTFGLDVRATSKRRDLFTD
jgi:hypothetical protein